MTDQSHLSAETLAVEEFLDIPGDRCAVLGSPIAHSLSPLIHNAGYIALGINYDYYRVEVSEARHMRKILNAKDPGIKGLSVTMPGKGAALKLAELSTKRAADIGSANTLVPQEDGRWLADNTDVDGLTACLNVIAKNADIRKFDGQQAVVVGNGGTARPAVAALAAAGINKVVVLARSERALNLQALVEDMGMEFSWARLDAPEVGHICGQSAVVISTVPEDSAAEHAADFIRADGVVDVIYDPYPTRLLEAAISKGLPHADGLNMLAGQAEEQFRLFTGVMPPEGLFLETLHDTR